ncbi:hypothetical protein [Variovorax sp. dw_308]|uniref:hypothetical protein n=1 Tax=Variovorax sp. dw_308 TaxID=2721546 RepID=UPI001C454030|nr:hypothetical protein [Variovorax sp. dw_308]
MKRLHALPGLLVSLLLAACATGPDTVVFVTKSSLAIDVEQTPPAASIAYDRVEGYFGPRYDTSAVPPVLATFTTNGKLLDRQVKQVYATGDAARVLANPNVKTSPDPALTGNFKPMFFGTSTTLGLKLGFEASGSTSTFTLGYKRKELSVIPVTDGAFPSVLATLQSDVDGTSAQATQFGAGQLFATGSVATDLARQPEVRRMFMSKANSALDAYRLEERTQSRAALVTLSCLASLGDAQLPKVWNNADALGVLDKEAKVGDFATMTPAAARNRYTMFLVEINADSPDTTLRMNLHRQYVCGLAGRPSPA